MDDLLPNAPDYPRAIYQALLRIERILMGEVGKESIVEQQRTSNAPVGAVSMLSVVQVARRLGISRTKINELLQGNKLLHLKVGRRIVIPEHAIELLLNGVAPDKYLAAQRKRLGLEESQPPSVIE